MKVLDLHCDTLYELNISRKSKVAKEFGNSDLHIDLDKLIKGNYLLQCFAVFVNLKETINPTVEALEEIDVFYQIMKTYSNHIAMVKNYSDILSNQKQGKISGMLTMEDGGSCLGNISLLHMFYELGVRMMTLTWNYENELGFPNIFADNKEWGSAFIPNTTTGLKQRGIEFLEEMERLHMIVDVSHLSDAGFFDVAKHTKRPFIASHSNARVLSPHVRNLNDEMLYTIGNRGGLIGINYNATFLDNKEVEKDFKSMIKLIVDHIVYIKDIAGIEAIALGSDFDGISCELELKDASYMPMLVGELEKRGFHESEIEQIFYKNALKVFKELLF